MNQETDQRSPLAAGLEWASRVTTLSLQMVVLGLAGYWLDGKAGTLGLFTLIGFSLGMTLGVWQLIRFTRQQQSNAVEGEDPR